MTEPNPASASALMGTPEGVTERYVKGLWRGLVVDDQDPDKRARVKVRVDMLHGGPDEISDVDLPFAEPCFPTIGTQDPDGNATVLPGWVTVPPIGTTVWVAFENGYIENPIYMGQYYGLVNNTPELPSEALDTNLDGTSVLPKRRVFKTPGGHVVEVDDNVDTQGIRVLTIGGYKLTFDDAGDSFTIEDANGNIFKIDTAGDVITINAQTTIELGSSPTEPAVLGTALTTLVNAFITFVNAHTHPETGGTTLAPSPTFGSTMGATEISAKTKIE